MNISPLAMLSLSIMTTLIMILISFLMYLSGREKSCAHILEFWIAYLVYFGLSYLTQGHGPRIVALSTLGLLWRMRTVMLIVSDVAKRDLMQKWHVPLIGFCYILSLLLSFFDLPFAVFTFPAVASISIVGMHITYSCWSELKKRELNPLHYLFLFNLLVLYAHILDYPFLRFNHDFTGLGFAIVLLSTLVMAIVLPAIVIHDLQIERGRIVQVVLNERNLLLEKQSKMSSLGEMTASLVHELNNPLSLLLTRNSLLKRKVEKDQCDKENLISGLIQMDTTIQRMIKITHSLKAFSRESDKEAMRKVELKTLVEETLAFSSERFLEGNLPLLMGEIPDVLVECRSVQISQVLLNLLNNAYDAVQGVENRWVKVDFEMKDKMIHILVIDSGKGIPNDLRVKIMHPFFTTKEIGKGTGLGLSISLQIAKEHNGRLFLKEDILNTTFILELPYSAG